MIVLPMLRSPLSALGIFSSVAQWNNFLQPLIFLNTPQKFTVPCWWRNSSDSIPPISL